MIETCMKGNTKKYLNVIIDWTEKDVWAFIKLYKLPYPSLYDEGFKRIGCVFCPLASNKERDVKRFPVFHKLFIKAFEKLYEAKKLRGKSDLSMWKNGEEMFNWWISKTPSSLKNKYQKTLFD